jgi:hypothetical protein
MLLFSMFFPDAMGVRRVILQFGGSLVVLVMGSVVVSGGHCFYRWFMLARGGPKITLD